MPKTAVTAFAFFPHPQTAVMASACRMCATLHADVLVSTLCSRIHSHNDKYFRRNELGYMCGGGDRVSVAQCIQDTRHSHIRSEIEYRFGVCIRLLLLLCTAPSSTRHHNTIPHKPRQVCHLARSLRLLPRRRQHRWRQRQRRVVYLWIDHNAVSESQMRRIRRRRGTVEMIEHRYIDILLSDLCNQHNSNDIDIDSADRAAAMAYIVKWTIWIGILNNLDSK